jgi:hypothetical protein
MRLSYFPKYAAQNSAPVIEAFLHGLQHLGVEICANDLDSDGVILWSQLWAGRMQPNREIYQHYMVKHGAVIVIDVGAIARNHTWRISLWGNARLAGQGHDPARREKLGMRLAPWRSQGRHIVIAMQRPDSNQWQGMPDPDVWLAHTVERIRSVSDRPIRVRPHPRYSTTWTSQDVTIEQPLRISGTYDDYDFDRSIHDAWAVINWNSTPGIISALRGVPIFVGAASLAAAVGNVDLGQIDNPAMPDREQWCNDLAWTEWTLDEIHSGQPQRLILGHIRDQRTA